MRKIFGYLVVRLYTNYSNRFLTAKTFLILAYLPPLIVYSITGNSAL